ncbi:MAG: TrkA family potassium uptake protein [Clostridiales bacterium]|jgi:trk system potassium uptake protein TrkA|nr:TrkA family potassium uptake protein [Clostridiales bacterium]
MKRLKEKKEKNDYVIVIGCGRLGASVADALSDGGRSVLIIDKDNDAFKKLSSSYGGLTLNGDATELHVLNEAGADKAAAVVIVTNNDNTNILIAQLIKDRYGADNVIARLYEPERAYAYEGLNISTVCPARLSANEINSLLQKGL